MRSFEISLKLESFKINFMSLLRTFQIDFEMNNDIVVNQFIIVFKKFGNLQQKINDQLK